MPSFDGAPGGHVDAGNIERGRFFKWRGKTVRFARDNEHGAF